MTGARAGSIIYCKYGASALVTARAGPTALSTTFIEVGRPRPFHTSHVYGPRSVNCMERNINE